MKHLFLLCLSVLLLASCSSGRYPSALYVADSLSVACPERAVALLDSLRPQMEQEGERVRMYYQLLCVKARDKAYLPHTSDSLVLEVLRYYEDKQDRRHLPEAYYYAGRVASDLGDAPQALDYFQQALDAMPEGEMTDLRSRTISQMGTLFSAQGLYKEALKMRQESFRCDSLLNDSIGLAFSLRDIGLSYHDLEEHELELDYYLRAYQISTAIRQANLIHSIQCCLANAYSEQGQYEEALRYLRKALADIGGPGRNAICLTAGFIYHALGMKDSAAWYYQEILRLNYPQTQRIAYGNLGQLAVERGDPAAALALFRKYVNLTDSLSLVSDSESIRRMNALYNYQLREKENIRLKESAKRRRLLMIGVLTLGIALIAGGWIYHVHKKRRLVTQLNRLEQLNAEIYRKTSNYIADKQSEISRLDENIRSLKAQLEEAELQIKHREQEAEKVHELETSLAEAMSTISELEKQKDLAVFQKTNAESVQNQQYKAENLLYNSDIYQRLKQIVHGGGKHSVTRNDWEALQQQIDLCFEGFSSKVKSFYPIKERDFHICMLLRAGFQSKEIALLVCLSAEGVCSACRRMHAKAFCLPKGNPKEWTDIIRSL